LPRSARSEPGESPSHPAPSRGGEVRPPSLLLPRLAERVGEIKAAFEVRLRAAMADAGHPTAAPFGLTLGLHGAVQVFPHGHPLHAALEGLFQAEPGLKARFRELERAEELLRSRQELEAFEAACALDPRGALAGNGWRFGGPPPSHAFWVEVTRTGLGARWEDGYRAG
jgi:hypothetical protein